MHRSLWFEYAGNKLVYAGGGCRPLVQHVLLQADSLSRAVFVAYHVALGVVPAD